MSRKIVEMKHHLCSGCCMWSGIEDVYANRLGEVLPDAFLFAISSFAEPMYIKTEDTKRRRMLGLANGMTEVTYNKIKDALGLDFAIISSDTSKDAFNAVRKEIDAGRPVILGPLDMYHLPYLKMYHFAHIPIHYILMVGYYEEKEAVLVYDCDREDLQTVPFSDLVQAWDVPNNVVGGKNGYVTFTLPKEPIKPYELAKIALKRKAEEQLREFPSFAGVTAFDEIAEEFPHWKEMFTPKEYSDILKTLTESMGTVPKLPDRMMGIPNSKDFPFCGCYDRFGNVLLAMGEKYDNENWTEAGKLFCECGQHFQMITNLIVSYVCDGKDVLDGIPKIYKEIGALSLQGYTLLL